MLAPSIAAFRSNAESILAFLQTEFRKLQTGRANAALIEHIEIDAYGQKMQIRAIAGITVSDARSIVVQPWDRSMLSAIDKALQQVNLGTTPVNDGTSIRICLPPMTEERRIQLAKVVQKLAEEARISVRKTRQEAHDVIKSEKDEDVRETMNEALQKEVDGANDRIAECAKKKEQEILSM